MTPAAGAVVGDGAGNVETYFAFLAIHNRVY